MKRVVAFDFDGTITSKDTLVEFLKFTFGWRFYINVLLLSPIIVSFRIGLLKNHKTKQLVFSFFFKGWHIEKFNIVCNKFIKTIKTRPLAIETIKQHLEKKDKVLIVSASFENWVHPWARVNGINHVLATKIEVENDIITGKFSGKNCYGIEKVKRLEQIFPNRKDYHLVAYGDSKGDRELLAFANEGYFKKF